MFEILRQNQHLGSFGAKIKTYVNFSEPIVYIQVYGIVTWRNPRTDALAFQEPDFETWCMAWRQAGMTESGRMACAI